MLKISINGYKYFILIWVKRQCLIDKLVHIIFLCPKRCKTTSLDLRYTYSELHLTSQQLEEENLIEPVRGKRTLVHECDQENCTSGWPQKCGF